MDIPHSAVIYWQGWETTLAALISNNWEISFRPKYDNWRDPIASESSNNYFYLVHKETNMLGRFIPVELECSNVTRKYYKLDFLVQNKKCRVMRKNNIQNLLEEILEMQELSKPKKKPTEHAKQQAEILLLRA